MALSLAYDHDLTYERRDLDRFYGLYRSGPDGIFLKKGKQLKIRVNARAAVRPPDQDAGPTDRSAVLREGADVSDRRGAVRAPARPERLPRAPRAAAVRRAACAATSSSRRESAPTPALIFTLAFVGATFVPVYAVFLTPELLNFAIIFFAYFFWLYKEVRAGRTPVLRGRGSDVAAAILLGLATYSKPPNHVLLVAPIVLLLWWRRHWRDGVVVGGRHASSRRGFFGVNALTAGEFNYQGGDRKTFYTGFRSMRPTDTSGIAEAW